MTIHPLAAAFTALLPAQWPIYDGQILDDKGTPYPADDLPTPPWIFLDFPEPDALERSLAGGVHAITIEGRVLLYHTDIEGIRLMASHVTRALDTARLTLPGWAFGLIRLDHPIGPGQDRDVKYTGGIHPIATSYEFTFTASKGASP
jgi:hypothetical protein